MRTYLALAVLAFAAGVFGAPSTRAQDVEALRGRWEGALDVGGGRLPLVLHLDVVDGALTATLDSPSQEALGLAGEPTLTGDQLIIEVPSVRGSYTATVQGDTLDGTWTQGTPTRPKEFSLIESDRGCGKHLGRAEYCQPSMVTNRPRLRFLPSGKPAKGPVPGRLEGAGTHPRAG